jgi:hypothetical protein
MTSTLDLTAAPEAAPAEPSRARTLIGSTSLVLGTLAIALIGQLSPYDSDLSQVEVVRTSADRITLWSLTWLASSLLLLVGASTVVGRIRGRGSALATVGGALAGAGAVGSAAVASFESVGVTLAGAISSDEQLASVLTAFDTSTVLMVVFLLWLPGLALGLPLLTGAAARARLIPAWLVIPVAVAVVAMVIEPDVPLAVEAALTLGLIAPMALIALRLIQRPQQ